MRIPGSTYRLQFNTQFDFAAAGKILEYLSVLGISDIYASPIFKAKKGSLHGYDVIDALQINPELGGASEFEKLIMLSKTYGLGWLQDIVPNHMAYDSDNKMLMDVFENGPYSQYAGFFDIDFNHPYENLKNKILAPFLGEFYGHCLDKNEIQIKFSDRGFFLQYYDWIFPLRMDSYLTLLSYDISLLGEQLGQGHEHLLKMLEIIQALKALAPLTDPQERSQQIMFIKAWLWNFYSINPIIHDYIDDLIKQINTKTPGSPAINYLDKLLSEQFFRLSFWKVGNEELNYRRFFTINSLICLRMENYDVFEHTHRLIVQLTNEGKFTGLRIDHLDGLYDPAGYLKNIRQKTNDIYIIVEKILDLHETLPAHFNIQGTTGYEFMNFVNEIFVDRKNEKKIDNAFTLLTQKEISYQDLVVEKKQLFIGKHMAGDIDNLAHLLRKLLNRNRYGKDLTMYGLRRALVEIMAQFPVYRTYIDSEQLNDTDKVYVKEALIRARRHNPGTTYESDAIEKILLLNFDPDMSPEEKAEWLHFTKRFQQYTGPLMAKGAEDTTFYIYNRLISLNEVGGNPDVFGISVQEFHEFNMRRLQQSPHTFNATSTHDTKRGEDVRCRINILSEIPQQWVRAVKSWSKINESKKQPIGDITAPEKDDEYFIYQTLIGAFPFQDSEVDEFRERMQDYIVKAIREAKIHTAWIKPDLAYEEICVNFIKAILASDDDNEFLKRFIPFQKKISRFGVFNSLSQVLLKLTCPGVPDFYQGSELWDLNLVDPDNRRPVNYERRKTFLNEIKTREAEMLPFITDLWEHREDGRIKMFLIYRALSARNKLKELFQKGQYIPLEIRGELKNNVMAFARRHNQDLSISVIPLFVTQCMKENEISPKERVWNDTAVVLPKNWPIHWQDVITGQMMTFKKDLEVETLLKNFPVGMVVNPF